LEIVGVYETPFALLEVATDDVRPRLSPALQSTAERIASNPHTVSAFELLREAEE
jgi:hypothetical protein